MEKNEQKKHQLGRYTKVVGLGLLVCFIVAIELYQLPDASDRVRNLPAKAFGVSSRDIPFTETEISVLGKACSLRREYQCGNQRVMVTILDGNENRHAVHDPLYCIHGAGWLVEESRDMQIPGGDARQLIVHRNGSQSEILYWFSTPGNKHTSLMRYRWQTVLRRITFGRAGKEPVLVLLQPATTKKVDWQKFFSDFTYLSNL
jgi:hypothetical protein